MRKFFALPGLFALIFIFASCTGFYDEKKENGSISLDFSRAINAISSRTNFQEIDDAISPDDQYLNDLIKRYIKYKLLVQIKQVDGEYTASTSVDIPFDQSSLLKPQIVEIENVPVGIRARVAAKLTLEGFTDFMTALEEYYSKRISEMVEEQLAEMIKDAEEAGSPLSEEMLAIIREQLEKEIKLDFQDRIDFMGLDNEITLAGESEEFVTIAGNNPVKVKLVVIDDGSDADSDTDTDTDTDTDSDTDTETDTAADGVTIGTDVEYNKPLVLGYRDDTTADGFKFIVKVATEGYENIVWTVTYDTWNTELEPEDRVLSSNLEEPFMITIAEVHNFTFTNVEGQLVITSDDVITSDGGYLSLLNDMFNNGQLDIKCEAIRNGITETAYFNTI